MSALLLLLLIGQTPALRWNSLPSLPYRTEPQVTPQMQAFVSREIRRQRCTVIRQSRRPDRQRVEVELAVLVDEAGGVRVVVPRAINCPSVEQYAAGVVTGFARGNVLPRGATSVQWYRTTVIFYPAR